VNIGFPERSAVSCYFAKNLVVSHDTIANCKMVIERDNTVWSMFTTWTFNHSWNALKPGAELWCSERKNFCIFIQNNTKHHYIA
jgi:hypothetical protein